MSDSDLNKKLDEILKRQPIDLNRSWTYADVGRYLDVSESTVRRMAKQPGFPRPREKQTDSKGTSIKRFVSSEIVAWLERHAA